MLAIPTSSFFITSKKIQSVSKKISYHVGLEIKKKEHVLLIEGELDWLQIWIAASLLNVNGNKAIKKDFVFLSNRLVSQIQSQI